MKPILFNTEMVRAILDGRKTQTRRIIKPQPDRFFEVCDTQGNFHLYDVEWGLGSIYPRYQIGDILWARETWQDMSNDEGDYVYLADGDRGLTNWSVTTKQIKWRPSIYMPREAARIFLRVTNVRVERLRDIGGQGHHDDLFKEGAYQIGDSTGREMLQRFAELWNSTIEKKDLDTCGWEANPWVWVYEFERVSEDGSSKDE